MEGATTGSDEGGGERRYVRDTPNSFHDVPTAFITPYSSLAAFPLTLQPVIRPRLLLPTRAAPV